MPSFSRRLAVTAFSQVSERAPQAGRTTEISEDDIQNTADRFAGPAGEQGTLEDVDFDTAIAEVLMTLAADQGSLENARPTETREASAALVTRLEYEDDIGFDDEDDSEDDSDGDATDGEAEARDPEALLAAEAATFRLLGELDRLWHRAA